MTTVNSNFSRLQELLPELFQAGKVTGTSYLRTQLTPQLTVLLSMDLVQESLLVTSEQITAIPSMPDYFVGLMSSRDRVFCLIDLPQFLGLPSNIRNARQTYHTVIVRVTDSRIAEKEFLVGLIFEQVQGVTRVKTEKNNNSLDHLPQSLIPYVEGCLIDKNQSLPILGIANIIQKIIKK